MCLCGLLFPGAYGAGVVHLKETGCVRGDVNECREEMLQLGCIV